MDQLQPDQRLLGVVQSLVARYAISGRYPAGAIPVTLKFVSGMPIKPFATEDERILRIECSRLPSMRYGAKPVM